MSVTEVREDFLAPISQPLGERLYGASGLEAPAITQPGQRSHGYVEPTQYGDSVNFHGSYRFDRSVRSGRGPLETEAPSE
jgi:hypothetical protein